MATNDLPIRRPTDAIPVLEQRYGLRVTRQTLWRWRKRWPLRLPCSIRDLIEWFERQVFPQNQWRYSNLERNSQQLLISIIKNEFEVLP